MISVLSLFMSSGLAQDDLSQQLSDWQIQSSEVVDDSELNDYLKNFAHAFNKLNTTVGGFSAQGSTLEYTFNVYEEGMNTAYYKHLTSKYSKYVSPGQNATICFNENGKDYRVNIDPKYLSTLLKSINLTWDDFSPKRQVSFNYDGQDLVISAGKVGSEFFDMLVEETMGKKDLVLSISQFPNEFNYVLEVDTLNDVKIQLPVSVNKSRDISEETIYWKINGRTSSVQVNQENAFQEHLFNEILKDRSIKASLSNKMVYSENKSVIGSFDYDVHLMNQKNQWFGTHKDKVKNYISVSKKDGCSLFFDYSVKPVELTISRFEAHIWGNVTTLNIVDSYLYSYKIGFVEKAFTGNKTAKKSRGYISYDDFDELVQRPPTCKTTCSRAEDVTSRYLKFSFIQRRAQALVMDEKIERDKCQAQCEQSQQYSQCLLDATSFKIPINSPTKELRFRAEALNFCQESLSSNVFDLEHLLNGTPYDRDSNLISISELKARGVNIQVKPIDTLPKSTVSKPRAQTLSKAQSSKGTATEQTDFSTIRLKRESPISKIPAEDSCRVHLRVSTRTGRALSVSLQGCDYTKWQYRFLERTIQNFIVFNPSSLNQSAPEQKIQFRLNQMHEIPVWK